MAAAAESTVEILWGNTLLPDILNAIGGLGDSAHSVDLHFEYGRFVTALLKYGCGSELTRQLPLFGTDVISAALGAPKGLQMLTLHIEKDEFTICQCRYIPIAASWPDFLKALTEGMNAAT